MLFKGSTGSELAVKLASSILEYGWTDVAVRANALATIQVVTQFVADGSTIKITLLDGNGKKHGTLEGKVFSNIHRVQVSVPQGAKDVLLFHAELPAHGLDVTSGRIRIDPAVGIEEPVWVDEQGKALEGLSDQVQVRVQTRVLGIPDGTACRCRILASTRPKRHEIIHEGDAVIKEGKLDYKWNVDFPHDPTLWPSAKEGEKYDEPFVHAYYVAEFSCQGIMAASKPLTYKGWIRYQIEGFRGTLKFQLPDGRIQEIHTDGQTPVLIQDPGVGEVILLESIPDDEEGNSDV